MDPVTHALAGAAAARTLLPGRHGAATWLAGAAGALVPDADAVIRSSTDPLLYAEFHRHFTHSLVFIPLGGVIAALPWLAVRRARAQWKHQLAAATAGCATHGVLDAATTYGTLLYWPFSENRVAWNIISIVDPLFTLMLLGGVVAAAWTRRAAPVAVALALAGAYLGVGAVQHDRALAAQARIAATRGHVPDRGAAFPAFATTMVWRSLYRYGDTLYMDRLRLPWFGPPTWSEGYQMRLATAADLPADIGSDARLRRDFGRFSWFAGAWVAHVPETGELADARYSSSTVRFEPVWGIRFRPQQPVPGEWIDRSAQRRIDPRELWDELRGAAPGYRPLRP